MLYMLTIGYHKYLLESDTGIATVMKCLSKSTHVVTDARYRDGGLELDQEPVQVSMEVLNDFKLVKRPRQAKATGIQPEVLPPHVNALDRAHRRQLMMHNLTGG